MPQNETVEDLGLEEYKYDFITEDKPVFKAEKGLSESIVRQISAHKEEPEWPAQGPGDLLPQADAGLGW
jgi:Fe-S cluster assembly protein SufB